MSDSLIKIMR